MTKQCFKTSLNTQMNISNKNQENNLGYTHSFN